MTSRPDEGLIRLTYFSDAVFAIAMTVLALELKLPPLAHPVTADALTEALGEQWPKFLIFFISFEVIGIFWLGHHRSFEMIHRFDRRLARHNLLFLFFIVMLPFSTTLIGEYGNLPPAAVFYGSNLVGASLMMARMWRYASHDGRLLDPEADPVAVRAFSARAAVTLALFVISDVIAIRSPRLAQLTWIAVALVAPLAERWARRRAQRC